MERSSFEWASEFQFCVRRLTECGCIFRWFTKLGGSGILWSFRPPRGVQNYWGRMWLDRKPDENSIVALHADLSE
jgi:hypothetical protein